MMASLLFVLILLVCLSSSCCHDVKSKFSIANMTCQFFQQPLNHHDLPVGKSGTYRQRYCYYNGFVNNRSINNDRNRSINRNGIHANYSIDDSDTNQNRKGAPTERSPPIFLYVGNESPIEQYINNTGLMWELGEQLKAQIIFIEHRYEGYSIPNATISNCMAYSSSIQALADYANFIENVIFLTDPNSTTKQLHSSPLTQYKRPIIAFGGSYGGMLATWIRQLYPHLVVGAIAASAPVCGFPFHVPNKIDSAYQIINRGLQLPYPPTSSSAASTTRKIKSSSKTSPEQQQQRQRIERTHETRDNTYSTAPKSTMREITNHCSNNLLATWPLLSLLGTASNGREFISNAFHLCKTLETYDDIKKLQQWIRRPWFLLAEGSYPYPSTYIPYAITLNEKAILPAWPLQAACWNVSNLYMDYGVQFIHGIDDVRYDIIYETQPAEDSIPRNTTVSSATIRVDWENVTFGLNTSIETFIQSKNIENLLVAVRDAISIWYNMTKDVSCYDITGTGIKNSHIGSEGERLNLLNVQEEKASHISFEEGDSNGIDSNGLQDSFEVTSAARLLVEYQDGMDQSSKNASSSTVVCKKMLKQGSWRSLCCNEPMNLIITAASGMGRDMFWPPSYPRGTQNYNDIIAIQEKRNPHHKTMDRSCLDPHGYYGYPQGQRDYRSIWYDTVYGGGPNKHAQSQYSNIVFSNGLLDPWSAAGVYSVGNDPTPPNNGMSILDNSTNTTAMIIPGLYVQNISDTSIALIMEYGGHHTDLMYSSPFDPPSIKEARQIEKQYIEKWIGAFWDQK